MARLRPESVLAGRRLGNEEKPITLLRAAIYSGRSPIDRSIDRSMHANAGPDRSELEQPEGAQQVLR